MNTTPFFSVIIPTCHRNYLLAKCLDCLTPKTQAFPAEQYEVIVTDDGYKTTAEEMIRKCYPQVKWVEGPHKGPAANRNNGVKHARGKWIAFVDDDCLPDKSWLNAISKTIHDQDDLDVVEGKTIIPDKVDNPFRHGPENLKGGNFWTCNLALKREAFCQLGGFDEDFTGVRAEDKEFAFRIKANQLRTYFSEEALVRHPTRKLSLHDLIRGTFLTRWIIFYRLKTGQAPPLSSNPLKALSILAIEMCIDLVRQTLSAIIRLKPESWRTQLFKLFWKWLTFPVLFPYLLIWEMRFRRQLSAGANQFGGVELKPGDRSPLRLRPY